MGQFDALLYWNFGGLNVQNLSKRKDFRGHSSAYVLICYKQFNFRITLGSSRIPFKFRGITHGETSFGEAGPRTRTVQSKPKWLSTVSLYNNWLCLTPNTKKTLPFFETKHYYDPVKEKGFKAPETLRSFAGPLVIASTNSAFLSPLRMFRLCETQDLV